MQTLSASRFKRSIRLFCSRSLTLTRPSSYRRHRLQRCFRYLRHSYSTGDNDKAHYDKLHLRDDYRENYTQQVCWDILAASVHDVIAHRARKSGRLQVLIELAVDDVIVVVFLGHVERQETGANAAQGCPRREYDVIRRSSTDSAHHRRKPVDLLQSALP